MDAQKIAERLIKLRGNRTQAEVAEMLGISQSAYSMYENGERIPRDEIKKRIAQFYKRSVNVLRRLAKRWTSVVQLRVRELESTMRRSRRLMNEFAKTRKSASKNGKKKRNITRYYIKYVSSTGTYMLKKIFSRM